MDKPYIICTGTSGRAVVYGYSETEPVPGNPFHLKRARMVISWSAECGGLLGLAKKGPQTSTRLTAIVSETGGDDVKQWVAVDASEAMDAWPAC